MASRLPDDIMLPPSAAPASAPAARSRLVAFVPITVALVGVAAIMLGHITAADLKVTQAAPGIDPIETGSIALAPASGYGIDAVRR
jgi:hypothetical protein